MPDEEGNTAPEVVPLLDSAADTVPDDWVLSLRGDGDSARRSSDDPPNAPSPSTPPTLDELAPLTADPDAPQMSAASMPVGPDPDDLVARKAQRRAAVRRSQQRRRPPTGHLPPVLDVLVLEAEPKARAELCRMLELFGFRPHVAVSTAEAEGLSLRLYHVAAFLGMGSDCDSEDIEALCRRLHDAPRGRPMALIAIGERRRHADRIRMQLAGADHLLFRPVARGDLARALDDCGLRLPRDPREPPAA